MDVWRLIGAAARRWQVFLVLLAVAAAAAAATGARVTPEYTSSASILLVGPSVVDVSNPYADLDTAAQSLAIVLQSDVTRGAIVGAGLTEDYEITAVSRTPILQATVRASSPEVAVATAAAIVSAADAELTSRQDASAVGAPNRVRVDVLSAPGGAAPTGRGQLQAQVAVLGLGAVLAFFAAVFFDDALLLMKQRRQRMEGTATSEEAPASTETSSIPVKVGAAAPSNVLIRQRRLGSARVMNRRVPAGKTDQ